MVQSPCSQPSDTLQTDGPANGWFSPAATVTTHAAVDVVETYFQ